MVSCMCNWGGWLSLFGCPRWKLRDLGHWPSFFSTPFFMLFQQIVAVNVPPEDQDGSGDDSDNFSGSGAGKADPEPWDDYRSWLKCVSRQSLSFSELPSFPIPLSAVGVRGTVPKGRSWCPAAHSLVKGNPQRKK